MENSRVVTECQVCGFKPLTPILFLGYLPPVNTMPKMGDSPQEQPSFPAQILSCERCSLVQLGLIVSPEILFPKTYPYTSSTTKILRDNFAELYQETKLFLTLASQDLVIDIGSNDGNLLSNFKDHCRVLGITPEKIGELAIERGIPTVFSYFTKSLARQIRMDPRIRGDDNLDQGPAKIITATNVFAHIDNVHEVIEGILDLLAPDGIFISESHYLSSLIETLQYDTIYHEHLRYYSLQSLKYLFEMHDLEIIYAKKIPTHGGSIRIYTARKNAPYSVTRSVEKIMKEEKKQNLEEFKHRVVVSKLELHALLLDLVKQKKRIFGIGAPSRASTLINYAGIDDGMMECVCEVQGSYKIGNRIPGTLIPVVDEKNLYEMQPDYAMLFSWHIADELIPKIKAKGFKGKFIIPLPKPIVIPAPAFARVNSSGNLNV